MENLLTNLPVEYLQHLYEQKFSSEIFKIDGENVYEDTREVLYSDEMFKAHEGLNVQVSNYGRIKTRTGIIKQEVVKKGYPFVTFPYRVSDLEMDIAEGKGYRYRTPIANGLISQATDTAEIKHEKYKAHPYLQIYLNERGLVFAIEYGTNRKIFFNTFEAENGAKMASIPISVYRLVAETWAENPDPKKYNEVHHMINNGYNNTCYNLLWVTNEQHKIIEKRNW